MILDAATKLRLLLHMSPLHDQNDEKYDEDLDSGCDDDDDDDDDDHDDDGVG